MRVTLLGPQRKTAAARAAVAELMPDGPVVAVNAGWQEREGDDAELDDVLGGRMVNLQLYRRWQEVMSGDPGWAAAERALTELLLAQQALYAVRLQSSVAGLVAVARRTEVATLQSAAMEDAVAALQALDRWHLDQVAALRQDFYARVRLGEHEPVEQHRADVAAAVRGSAGLVLAGGHVGVLLHLLHIFGLAAMVREPLVAWSAGAMVLAETVVLFNDFAPEGPGPAEVYAQGLGAYAGVLPFPHARRRLMLGDRGRMRVLANRFAPARCVPLSDGERLDLPDPVELPAAARTLGADA